MLSIVSSNAMAEWVYVTETKKEEEKADGFIAYADPASIRKTGNRVKMWVMYDYYRVRELGIISARHKEEFDCEILLVGSSKIIMLLGVLRTFSLSFIVSAWATGQLNIIQFIRVLKANDGRKSD